MLILPLLAACGEKAAETSTAAAQAPVTTAPSAAKPTGQQAQRRADPDGELAVKVRNALDRDPQLARGAIDVTVDNGVASLWGTVANKAEKKRAADIAKSVSGVKSVESHLAVVKGS